MMEYLVITVSVASRLLLQISHFYIGNGTAYPFSFSVGFV